MEVARDRTALSRHALSRPWRLALEDGLVREDASLFDYGCGKGDDLRLLAAQGLVANGWDPNHRPDTELRPSAVVNLGYVINVIEAPAERAETLQSAWKLAGRLLIVAARMTGEERDLAHRTPLADGILTSRNTFQKFYEQQELKHWIEQVLSTEAIAAGPGIFYVFRDADAGEAYRSAKTRRRIAAPSLTLSEQRCREHPALVDALIRFYTERARLPESDELAESDAIASVFGSIKRAFQAILRTNAEVDWGSIIAVRREDMLLYLALSRFERGMRWSKLSEPLQRDVRALFGTYAAAQRQAETLLLQLGQPGAVDAAVGAATVGKTTPTAIYVHLSALDQLPLLLRAFAGCGYGYLGAVEGATLIKLYRREPKLSYLAYPDFDRDPHPALDFSFNIDLRELRLKRRWFKGQPNPPVLHRKECFVAEDYPRRTTFARLTKAEEAAGLLEATDRIGLRRGWEAVLAENGMTLAGHRLVRVTHAGVSASPTKAT
jgi:DNA phosphorothioation-associated putative methyltransferase